MNKNANVLSSTDVNLLIDPSVLADTLGGDPAQVRKYVLLFLETTKEGLIEIDVLLNLADLESIAAVGHRIRSAALTVGALRFADLCKMLEQLRHIGDFEKAKEIIAKMHLMLASIEEQVASGPT
jgi:two-component system, sensor histidine kinase and response regulator